MVEWGTQCAMLQDAGCVMWPLLHCSHKNATVRRSAAQFILTTVELVGGARVLAYSREVGEAILLAIVKLVRDNSPEAR